MHTFVPSHGDSGEVWHVICSPYPAPLFVFKSKQRAAACVNYLNGGTGAELAYLDDNFAKEPG